MALEKAHELRFLHRIYLELLALREKRRLEYEAALDAAEIPWPFHMPIRPGKTHGPFVHVQQAMTNIMRQDASILNYERLISEIKNPPISESRMTDEERVNRVMGAAISHKLDIAKMVQETQ
uniref:Uncharacterized protein n=1 Tax=Pseudomonas phage HRDY3 TaxID=3236930 RepID=A0AB39CDG6_9VIRU